MKAFFSIALMLLGLLVFPAALDAQAQDPETVFKAITEALNQKNADAAIAFVADNAVVTLVPAAPGTSGEFKGKAAILARFKQVIAANANHTFNSCQVSGDKVTCAVTYTDDTLKPLNIVSLEMIGEAVIQNGLLQSVTWTVAPESLAQLQAAIAKLPTTGAVVSPLNWTLVAAGLFVLVAGLGALAFARRVR